MAVCQWRRSRGLDHGHAAIDVQGVAGDVARLVARQEEDAGRDFLGCAHATHRHCSGDALALRLGERLGHRAGDEAGRHAVDGDAARRELGGERLRHADHARLGRRIIGLAGIAGDTDHRGDADDAAPAPLHHAAHRRARQAEAGGEVDVDHRLPILVLHAQRQLVAGEAGIVDEDVELTRRLLRRLDERVGGGRIGEVGGGDEGALAEHARQRTSPVTCSTSRRLISSGAVTAAAVTLATSGTWGSRSTTPASASAISRAAGAISAQWKGALTGSMIERLAPRAAAPAMARSTAALLPLTTTCAPPLSLATEQTSPAAASPARACAASTSSPISAAMAPAPTGTARCMARPRRFNSRAASASEKERAAASAEYSPSE